MYVSFKKRYLMSIMKKSYSALNLLFLRRNKSAWMEDYTTLSSYFYLKSFSFHQNSDSQTNLFEYMSNHQSSSNTPSQLSLLCKTFKSPELQQAEVNLIVITSRHLPYLDSVSLFFPRLFHRSPQRRWLQPYFDSSADYWTFWSIIFLSMGPFFRKSCRVVRKQTIWRA